MDDENLKNLEEQLSKASSMKPKQKLKYTIIKQKLAQDATAQNYFDSAEYFAKQAGVDIYEREFALKN